MMLSSMVFLAREISSETHDVDVHCLLVERIHRA
jgi:methylglyoxal synthase